MPGKNNKRQRAPPIKISIASYHKKKMNRFC